MPLPETPTPTPDEVSARCPNPYCREELWSLRRGEWTLRNRIVKLVGDQLVALCDECGTSVPLPWLGLMFPPAPPAAPTPTAPPSGVRLFLRTAPRR